MSTINPLEPSDFPLVANGQYVYARRSSSPIIGPVSMQLAADLAARLNRDEAAQANAGCPAPTMETLLASANRPA